ncbi:MAG: hypothetical protein U1F43_05310 [Myxococcota bacterium]
MNVPRPRCWKCRAILELVAGQPVGRSETCPECDSDIRSCRGCAYWDQPSRTCREPTAEIPADPERANFCSAYRLAAPQRDDDRPAGEAPAASATDAASEARRRLEALFSKK